MLDATNPTLDVLLDGEMGELVRSMDWSATPLGASQNWSPALRTVVRILLANRFPQLLWWGPEYISIYNDAYRPILGRKHPWALGKPVRDCWSEIWEILKPLIDTPSRAVRRHGARILSFKSIVLDLWRKRISRLLTAPCPTTPRHLPELAACWPQCTKSPRRS